MRIWFLIILSSSFLAHLNAMHDNAGSWLYLIYKPWNFKAPQIERTCSKQTTNTVNTIDSKQNIIQNRSYHDFLQEELCLPSKIELIEKSVTSKFTADHFESGLSGSSLSRTRKWFIHGQGLATSAIIRWLAESHDRLQPNGNIKAIVLEQTVLHPNNMLMNHIDTDPQTSRLLKLVSYLPFAQAWLPIFCKENYSLWNSIKTITSALKIKTEVPIVLIHSSEDKIHHVNQARMLYKILKYNGCKNVFLLEVPNDAELFPIINHPVKNEQDSYKQTLCNIWKDNNIPYQGTASKAKVALNIDPDPQTYQPSIKDVQERIELDENPRPNNIRKGINLTTTIALLDIGTYYCYKKWKH